MITKVGIMGALIFGGLALAAARAYEEQYQLGNKQALVPIGLLMLTAVLTALALAFLAGRFG